MTNQKNTDIISEIITIFTTYDDHIDEDMYICNILNVPEESSNIKYYNNNGEIVHDINDTVMKKYVSEFITVTHCLENNIVNISAILNERDNFLFKKISNIKNYYNNINEFSEIKLKENYSISKSPIYMMNQVCQNNNGNYIETNVPGRYKYNNIVSEIRFEIDTKLKIGIKSNNQCLFNDLMETLLEYRIIETN